MACHYNCTVCNHGPHVAPSPTPSTSGITAGRSCADRLNPIPSDASPKPGDNIDENTDRCKQDERDDSVGKEENTTAGPSNHHAQLTIPAHQPCCLLSTCPV